MRRALRKLAFSVLWDLGDWALGKAFKFDDSKRLVSDRRGTTWTITHTSPPGWITPSNIVTQSSASFRPAGWDEPQA